MPHGLNCPQDLVQLGSGTHQAEKTSLCLTVGASAVMNSGSNPEHTMSWFDNGSHARQQSGYMESQSPVELTSLVLLPSGYINQGNESWMKLPSKVFLGVHVSINLSIRQYFY
jgi:hypothetical protein